MDIFPVTKKLLNYSFKSYAKCQEYLISKEMEDERERNLKLEKEAASAAAEARKEELEAIRNEIEKCKLQVKTDGNKDFGVALESSAQTKIELGLGQKRQLEEQLEKLNSKKAKMSS